MKFYKSNGGLGRWELHYYVELVDGTRILSGCNLALHHRDYIDTAIVDEIEDYYLKEISKEEFLKHSILGGSVLDLLTKACNQLQIADKPI